MKLGFAEIDITPDRPLSLAGFAGEVRMGRRGERPLMAQAAFMQDDAGGKVLLFAADVIGFDQSFTDDLRQQLHEKLQLPPKHIILNASHTHCGPQTLRMKTKPDLGIADGRFLDDLRDKLFALGCEAVDAAAPASLRVCLGTNSQVTHRRRWEGDRWKNALNFAEEPERALPILDCRWNDGRHLLIVIASGHPTTWAEVVYDPHYIGRARERLRDELGEQTSVIILQGVSGDSKMTTPDPITRGWITDMKQDIRIASAKITSDILRALPFSAPLEPSFRIVTQSVELPLWQGLGRDFSTEEAVAKLANAESVASWQKLLTGESIPYEIQILAFSADHRWIVLGGEPCTGVGERLRRVFDKGSTFVMGYCNHLPCYIPSRRIAVEGGYEGRTSYQAFAQPHPLHPDVEDLIAAAVKSLKSGIESR